MATEPAPARLQALGTQVYQVDGSDIEALAAAAAEPHRGRPLVVLARTDRRRGLKLFRTCAPRLHYVRFKSERKRQRYRVILE